MRIPIILLHLSPIFETIIQVLLHFSTFCFQIQVEKKCKSILNNIFFFSFDDIYRQGFLKTLVEWGA